AGLVAGEGPAWVNVFIPFVILGMLVGYLSFGIASYRTPEYSQTVAFFLVSPAVIYAMVFVGTLTVGLGRWAFVFSTGMALGIIGVGRRLRVEREGGSDSKTRASPTT
ncbi:MAG: hypothetical protein V5A33_04590, partial [Halobacteriales archaeon]